jgi:hypothetical protein
VFHYCGLPLNTARTQGGTKVGRLLHPQVYDTINIDSLKWILPSNLERATVTAVCLILPIVEHCIYRLAQLGRVVPPVLGAWGFQFDVRSDQGFRYLVRNIIKAPPSDPVEAFTDEIIRFRRFQPSNYTDINEYPLENLEYMRHLVKFQINYCVEPLGHLPTPPVVCTLVLTRFEDVDHYAVV